jgi:FkbM family methyltransferase
MSKTGPAPGAKSGDSRPTVSSDFQGAIARSAAAALEQLCARFVAAAGEVEKARDEAGIARLRALRRQIAEALIAFPGPIGPGLAQALNATTAGCFKSAIRAIPRNTDEETLFARCCEALASAPRAEAAAVGLAALLMAWHAYEVEPFPPLAAIPPALRPSWLDLAVETPPAFVHRGDAERFARYLRRLCAWLQEDVDAAQGPVDDVAAAFSGSSLFMQSYFNELNLRDLMRARAALIETLIERAGGTLDQLRVLRPANTRPRIGFITLTVSDGTETSSLAAHLERLDRRRFDVRLFSLVPPAGRMGAVCRAAAEAYVQLPAQIPAAVARLRCEDLDIALFCTNVTATVHPLTQIAAHRVAPIQASTGASPVTTGLRNVDIMISGVPNETEGAAAHYTERLMLMPEAINCYAFGHLLDGVAKPTPASRVVAGIPEGAVLFFSAANYYKIQPELSELWFRILAQVPDSYLLLMPFNPNWSRDYQIISFHERLRRQAAEAGVPLSRLVLQPPVPTVAHLHRMIELADVYLDAFPFSGACSIYDTLETATPVVARAGTVCRARHSTAILEQAGLADWVASDDEAYVRRAVELARAPDRRAAERQRAMRIRDAGLRLVDTAPYAAMLMPLFERMVSDWNGRVEALRAQEPAGLARRIAALVPETAEQLRSFTDRDLVLQVVLPYLRNGGSRRLLDVGACVGAMSRPFLAEGWQTVMFEPDQRCHATLAAIAEAHPGQVRIEQAVVTADRDGSVPFHVAGAPGLSGMSRSPFAADLAVLDVRALALAPYIARNGLFDVDFIKIDAEGHDLAILEGIDFEAVAPRLIMVEFGDVFAGQDRAAIEAALLRMRGRRYRACVVCLRALGDMARHQWQTNLLAIAIDATPALPVGTSLFGNILFFRDDDCEFLPSVCDWLEQFEDRRQRGLARLR